MREFSELNQMRYLAVFKSLVSVKAQNCNPKHEDIAYK